MADGTVIPTATRWAVDSCVFALQTIGLDSGPIVFGMFGAVLGMSKAAPSSRWRAAAVFMAVVMLCALLGTWFSAQYMNGDKITANAASCIMALFFHLIWNAAADHFPKIFTELADIPIQFLKNWFGGKKP